MPWSGGTFTRTNGVFSGATVWAQDRDAGTKITAAHHDVHDEDLADGINDTLEKSGSNAATGNLNIGSNRLTAVADGTAKPDAATVNQIQSNGPAFQAADTGTANTHVIALSPAITAYAAGQEITFKAGAASTGASTLNVNTLGAKTLKKLNDQDIASGDIEAGSIVTAVYDGTNFQVTSQLASEPSVPAGAAHNIVTNGDFSVAQRGEQTGLGAADNGRTACDTWVVLRRGSPEGRMTSTQANAATLLNGHNKALRMDCTTAESSVGTAEALTISHKIEGFNLQSLRYGTANAESITLSFWFRSPKTGKHCAGLYLSDTGYSHVKEFDISSANTFEYFSLTFSGNTGQTINDDSGSGMIISFPLIAGGNFQATKDQWASGEDFATDEQQNLLDNTSNDVYVAGVQLQIGTSGTSFDYEDMSTTLAKCQRYYVVYDSVGTIGMSGVVRSTSGGIVGGLCFPVTMRSSPTATYGTFNGIDSSSSGVDVTLATNQIGVQSGTASFSGGSGFTDGNGFYCELKSGQTLQLSAEL